MRLDRIEPLRCVPESETAPRAPAMRMQYAFLLHLCTAARWRSSCRLIMILSACLLGACDSGTGQGREGASQQDAVAAGGRSERGGDSPPVLLVYHNAVEQTDWEGIEIAVWQDGYVLYDSNLRNPAGMVGATVKASQVQALLRQLDAAGFFSVAEKSYVRPDYPYVTFAVEYGAKRSARRWNEVMSRGCADGIGSMAEFIEFARTWIAARIVLDVFFGDLSGATEGVSGVVRGYNCDEPWTTPWLETVGLPEPNSP